MRILIYFTLLFPIIYCSQLECKDENNSPVDWFVMYKLPKLKTSSNKLVQAGLGYAFISSANPAKGWSMSTLSVGDPKSMPGQTLNALYNSPNKSESLWILYNDQPPTNANEKLLGHTKGVVVTQANGGFWLVHSVPHFPPPTSTQSSKYGYPETGQHYGQSFLCISVSSQQMDLIGVQLMYNEPLIYDVNAAAALAGLLPRLYAAAKNTRVTAAPWFHQTALTSRNGQQFQSFAKSARFNKDLYADWVAGYLKVNILVESWLNGPGKLPSDCKHKYSVENIASVKIGVASANFSTHSDHSKWATADLKATPWVCVGDINREAGQYLRGGGTVCIKHSQIWDAYHSSVSDVEPCPNT